jgi:hypothetical protein
VNSLSYRCTCQVGVGKWRSLSNPALGVKVRHFTVTTAECAKKNNGFKPASARKTTGGNDLSGSAQQFYQAEASTPYETLSLCSRPYRLSMYNTRLGSWGRWQVPSEVGRGLWMLGLSFLRGMVDTFHGSPHVVFMKTIFSSER